MTTSPGLFNIYMEEFMKHVKMEFREDLWYKLYADDLVFIIDYA
jgi:hypothetical protein